MTVCIEAVFILGLMLGSLWCAVGNRMYFALQCKAHVMFARCDFSHIDGMAEFGILLDQTHTGHFFWVAP